MCLGGGHVGQVSVSCQSDVIIVVETLDEVHRSRVCVAKYARLRAWVSHRVPSTQQLLQSLVTETYYNIHAELQLQTALSPSASTVGMSHRDSHNEKTIASAGHS